MEGKFMTDRGHVRPHNEDSGGIYYNKTNQLLAVIADGMGGHQAGDVASLMATEYIEERWKETIEFSTPESTEAWLLDILNEINNRIYKKSLAKAECEGMGTTIVISICTDEFITIGHVGDSRCYVLNEHGFKQVTNDHSLVNELLRLGEITKEDAEHHPQKNVVLKALGTEEKVTPDITILEWEENNKLLLCTDGLTDKVFENELSDYIEQSKEISKMGNNLIELANARGGEDNISLIIIKHRNSIEVGDHQC